jgi:hypothetical protein
MLKGNEDGFFLMVESARIDKYSHSLDWERSVFDTIMLDNAVKVAKDFAGERNDTLIIVVPTMPIRSRSSAPMTTSVRASSCATSSASTDSVPPNYGPLDAEGYPTKVDTSRRLAVVFGTYPDTCDTGRPSMDGERVPAVKRPRRQDQHRQREADCTGPLATRKAGNLPFDSNSGVHAADDVILTAMGPGAEKFRGHKPNTYVFRVMAEALALGGASEPSIRGDGGFHACNRLRSQRSPAAGPDGPRGGELFAIRSRQPIATIAFDGLYKSFGVLGFQFSDRVTVLRGKVRMTGYMAPPLKPESHFFVLTREPLAICPFCQSDADWPVDIVVVFMKNETPMVSAGRKVAGDRSPRDRLRDRCRDRLRQPDQTRRCQLHPRLSVSAAAASVLSNIALDHRGGDGRPFRVLDIPELTVLPARAWVCAAPQAQARARCFI